MGCEIMTASSSVDRLAPTPDAALIELSHISKRFGQVRALDDVSFTFGRGECVGVVGHNGAGKSTLMGVLSGVHAADEGAISVDGRRVERYDANAAHEAGVRCIFQELSLCANLSVAENMCVLHPELRGRGWRNKATALIVDQLDAIFPGHGLSGRELVDDLSLTQRQMVEIARAFTVVDAAVKLVILDEPTSSLDAYTADQLLAFIRLATRRGIGCILISHMLGEIERVADRVLVMRDGASVAVLPREGLTQDAIVHAMGQHAEEQSTLRGRAARQAGAKAFEWHVGPSAARRSAIHVARGEIVCFAGLAGQGQAEALIDVYRMAKRRGAGQRVAFVAGDRVEDGIFPLWSISNNLAIRWLHGAPRAGRQLLANGARTRRIVNDWFARIGIRGAAPSAGILSLSGGNQQKVLFARALASDADLILMDDPTRGVDIGTKRDIYTLVREEAANGRTFIWYTTENAELAHCDRVYVFRSGRVTRMLQAEECDEQTLLAASFEEQAA
jgi:ribose transport system ATP-binding protein